MNRFRRTIVRGIFIKNNFILLAKGITKSNYHLPGGEVENCESIAEALQREIWEELNQKAEIGDFIGVIENQWTNDSKIVYETNFLFTFNIPGESEMISAEDFMVFEWVSLDQFPFVNLKPDCLQNILPQVGKKLSSPIWISNFSQL